MSTSFACQGRCGGSSRNGCPSRQVSGDQAAHGPTIERSSMAFGTFSGPVANGMLFTETGSVSPAGFFTSIFEPGSSKASGRRYSEPWSASMVARGTFKWAWQSIDSKSCAAPLGGGDTGRNPTDRGKSGSKVHILVDARGAPLAIHITGANQHDKWSVDDPIFSIVVRRPSSEQHFCADKGYDFADVRAFVAQANYVQRIKRRRRRGEPEPCPIPGEYRYPARRWVVERTLAWLTKRRSIRTRWVGLASVLANRRCTGKLPRLACFRHWVLVQGNAKRNLEPDQLLFTN